MRIENGAPGAIPTRDLPLRRRTLYAAELREHDSLTATNQAGHPFKTIIAFDAADCASPRNKKQFSACDFGLLRRVLTIHLFSAVEQLCPSKIADMREEHLRRGRLSETIIDSALVA
jgi:hypothetical protein